jgi:hypothetical protein
MSAPRGIAAGRRCTRPWSDAMSDAPGTTDRPSTCPPTQARAPHDGRVTGADAAGGRDEGRDDVRDVPALSRTTLMMVRRALHAYRDGWLLDDRLVRAARQVADDARQQALPVEEMRAVLERDWAALDDARRLAAPEARALLARLTTLSVAAYAATAPAVRAPSATALAGGRPTADRSDGPRHDGARHAA